MNEYYCYILTFRPRNSGTRNDVYYIGQSKDVEMRLRKHKNDLRKGKHNNILLQRLYNECDGGELLIEILSTHPSRREAIEEEIRLIKNHIQDNRYVNIEIGGDTLTYHPNKEKRIKVITESLKLKMSNMSKEERRRIYGKVGPDNPMFGKTHTKEARKKISEKMKEWLKYNDPPALGIKRTKEQRKLLSELASKRTGSKNPFYGRKHTPETKEKIRKIHLGKKPPNERKVSIDGIVYRSVTEAGRQLGIHTTTVLHRLNSKNKKFINYKFL